MNIALDFYLESLETKSIHFKSGSVDYSIDKR